MRAALTGEVRQEERARRCRPGRPRPRPQRPRSPRLARVRRGTSAGCRRPTASPSSGATAPARRGRRRGPARAARERPVGGGEHDAGGPQRQRHGPGPHGPDADRVGRLVAAARDDRRARPEAVAAAAAALITRSPRGPRGSVASRPGRVRGRPAPRATSRARRGRTAACQRRRPCRGHGRRSAGDGRSPSAAGRARPGPDLGLVVADPDEFRGGEPGSASLPVIAMSRSGPTARRISSQAAPCAGRSTGSRAAGLGRRVEQHGAVHLPGQPDGDHVRLRRRRPRERRPDRRDRPVPPERRVLLAPERLRDRRSRTRRRRSPTTAPASSMRTALVAVVETSMPRT